MRPLLSRRATQRVAAAIWLEQQPGAPAARAHYKGDGAQPTRQYDIPSSANICVQTAWIKSTVATDRSAVSVLMVWPHSPPSILAHFSAFQVSGSRNL